MSLIPEGEYVRKMPACFDESVIGFPSDIRPSRHGVKEMLEVISILEDASIPCCVVAEAALIYFGAGRMMDEWNICVPTEMVVLATDALQAHSDRFYPFRPSAMYRPGSAKHHFPRFKFVNTALFFVLVPAQDCHVPCKPVNFELGQTGMPFPKLDVFAQSLLDTNNGVDLEDLVDGMNLSMEWGEENLDLDGTIDEAWVTWKIEALKKQGQTSHCWLKAPKSRRELWQNTVSADRKKRGQGWKYNAAYETRFWRRGQRDPRRRKGGF
ncbi:MAG: hypothetical protein ASARMPRED_003330 [Alectoria sarmentosa]|nr:MAG: hypothetical protein ASARMPRED_003330 [Alectoria sarmentosa]